MIKLVPFDETFGVQFMRWQLDADYARFFRGVERYLTLEECARINTILGETFMVSNDGVLVGACYFQYQPTRVVVWGLLIDKEFQGKGYALTVPKEIEKYLFDVRGMRKLMFYFNKKDFTRRVGLRRIAEDDLGYKGVGELEAHTFCNGEYEDLVIYSKTR